MFMSEYETADWLFQAMLTQDVVNVLFWHPLYVG